MCVAWGMNWVAIKVSLEGISPVTSAALRFILAAVCLFIYVKARRVPLHTSAKNFKYLAITAFLVYAVDYGLIYWGEQYLSAGVTSIFFSTFAIFTAVFSNFVFKNEAFSRTKFQGLLLGLVGIVIVFYDQLALTRFDTKIIFATAAIIIAAICASAATVMVKHYLAKLDFENLSFHQMWMGALFLALMSFIFENPLETRVNLRVGIAVIYMATIASAGAFLVYYRLLKEMSAISLSLIIYIIPLVALVGDFFIYGQVLPLRSFIGMALIFSGIWLTERKKKKQVPAASTV